MTLRLFHVSNSWGQALVLKSCLEFYGLNPVILDYQQLAMNPLKIIAFGGIRIHLPKEQLELGEDIRASQADYGLPDDDPVPEKIIGPKIRSVVGLYGYLFLIAIGLAAILPPLLAAVFWLALFPWLYLTLYWWFCAGIICIPLHAKYIALPRLRMRAV